MRPDMLRTCRDGRQGSQTSLLVGRPDGGQTDPVYAEGRPVNVGVSECLNFAECIRVTLVTEIVQVQVQFCNMPSAYCTMCAPHPQSI